MSDICISAPLLLKSFSKLTIEFSCSDIMPFAHHVHSSGYLMMRAANRQTEAKVDPRRYIVKVNIIRLRMSFVCPVPLSMPNWRPPFSPVRATLPKNSSVSDCLFGPLPFQYWTGGGGGKYNFCWEILVSKLTSSCKVDKENEYMPPNLYLLMGDETLELTIKAVEHNRWIQCFKSLSQILG